GAFFMGAICPAPATLKSVNVFDMGTTAQLTGSTVIDQGLLLGVRNDIALNANGASADFNSFTNTAILVPEPRAWLLAGFGLLVNALKRKSLVRPGSLAALEPLPSLCADLDCSWRSLQAGGGERRSLSLPPPRVPPPPPPHPLP